MNIKKLFATLAGVSLFAQTVVPSAGVFGATYSQELQDAYNWAYGKGVTTMSTIDNANMYGAITRAEMAKMLSVYAVEVLGYEADTTKACNFTDIESVKGDLHDYIIKSCQLGLMGQGITAFRPYDTISRAEFGTALSRTLWGDKYEGGTPYYANHLNALKAAGIMNQIANAESTKEVRGYVMLMLMRSEGGEAGVDCDDPVIALACNLDSEDCPAACKDNGEEDNKDEDEVVKSGSLAVSSSAADDRSVVVASGSNAVSDLDTLTFKTSEEVTLNKVTLEKYGYSSASNLISKVWLENEDGKVISNEAKPTSKGLVNLTIKKDYKAIDGTFNAIIVVETNSKATVGGTIGFKVTDVNSTAKDVDLGNYKAYTYDVVAYDGTKAKVTAKWGTKDYNYEGKAVEISKFKIKAPDDSAIVVNSFTLTNSGDLNIYDNIDPEDVEVTIEGKSVKANVSINKDEEMAISLKDSLEIASKEQVQVIVSAKLNSDFEDYGDSIQLKIAESTDISATDKNNARITVDKDSAKWIVYTINWWEIKITNTKLGPVEASINSTDVKLAEWYITIGEDIEDGTLKVTVTGSGEAIESMKLVFAGDEYDGETKDNGATWTFTNIEASESGKLGLYVDIENESGYQNKVLQFSIDWWNTFKYTQANKKASGKTPDISGTLTISKLTLTPAEGDLTNNLSSSDDIEFPNKETNTEVVFDGTYKADKQDINLNSFTVSTTAYTWASKIKFYLYVDDMETAVADATIISGTLSDSDDFNDILVKAGESVKVKVEAEIKANEAKTPFTVGKFKITLDGEDENDNDAGHAERNTSRIVIVDKGSVSVTDSSVAKKAVLRRASSAVIAEFTVKPEGANSVALEEISFELTFSGSYAGEVKLYVDGSSKKFNGSKINGNGEYKAEFNKNVDSNGVVVRIELDDELDGSVDLTKLNVNGKPVKNKDFSRSFEEAVVWFTDQSYNDDQTTFKFGIDKKDSATVENVAISLDWTSWIDINDKDVITAGTPYRVNNVSGTVKDVVAIRFTVNGGKSTTTAGTQAVVTWTVTALTATGYAWDRFGTTDWYYDQQANVGDTEVQLVHSGAAITYNATNSGAIAGLSNITIVTDWVADVTSIDASSYIEYTSAKYLDMFKIGKKEDGTRVQVGRLKNS